MKFYLILLCLVPLIQARSLSLTNICIAQHLKNQGIEVEDADDVSKEALSSKCSSVVEQMKANSLKGAFVTLFKKEKYRSFEPCIRIGITNSEFSDNILAVVYYKTNFAVDDSVRQAKQNLFRTKATEITTKHLLTCYLPQRFATIFDDSSNNELQSEEEILRKSNSSPEEDYCVR